MDKVNKAELVRVLTGLWFATDENTVAGKFLGELAAALDDDAKHTPPVGLDEAQRAGYKLLQDALFAGTE